MRTDSRKTPQLKGQLKVRFCAELQKQPSGSLLRLRLPSQILLLLGGALHSGAGLKETSPVLSISHLFLRETREAVISTGVLQMFLLFSALGSGRNSWASERVPQPRSLREEERFASCSPNRKYFLLMTFKSVAIVGKIL